MINYIIKKLKKISLVRSIYSFLTVFLYSQVRINRIVFRYYRKRFCKYSGAFRDSQEKDWAYMTWLYHVIEKGLTMPNMRLGFGFDKIILLDEVIDSYVKKYGQDSEIESAIGVLFEYEKVHSEFKLPVNIMNVFLSKHKQFPGLGPLKQINVTKDEFFSNIENPFDQFAKSRHSVRNFSGPISLEQIISAIQLAQTAPSACNRQQARIHIVSEKEKIEACLSLQNGNRGFGNLADKLIIITGDLSTILGAQEFLDLNTNVGIFIMNLSYALFYKKIGHCILNWYVLPKEDKKLRSIINISITENIVAFIICGDVPQNFTIACSPKKSLKNIYTIH